MDISQRIQRMTDEVADQWLKDLHEHIAKQHPHLKTRFWEKANADGSTGEVHVRILAGEVLESLQPDDGDAEKIVR